MIVRRLGAAGALLCFAAMLGACAPVADFTADHWPHWAGGLPADAPPRPGAPGYDEFIAHGEAAQNAPAPADGASATPSGSTGTVSTAPAPQFQVRNSKAQVGRTPASSAQTSAQRTPQTATPAAPVEAPSAEDPSVVKGGLY